MIFYVLIATFFFLGFFISDRLQDLYYKFSLLILFLFSSLRDISLGGYDTENYQSFFYHKTPFLSDFLNKNYEYEFGYVLFNSIIKTFVNDYRVFQIVYCIVSVFLLSIVIKKLTIKKKERNLFLFVYFSYRYMWNNFVLLRQNIAMLIVWILILIVFDKSVKYNFGIVISSFFHRTSISNIIFYPILKYMKKFKRQRMLLITVILSVFLLIFSKPIYSYLIKIFILISGSKYSLYSLKSTDNRGVNLINYFVKWFFVLIFYFNYNRFNIIHKEKLLYISFFVLILSSINVAIVGRLVEYYMIAIYSIIVISYRAFEKEIKILYLSCIYIIFIVILIRFLYTFSGGELWNYSTFLI